MVRSNMARATRLLCSAISFFTGSPCERTGGAERPVCHSLASQGWGARPLLVLSGRQDDGCRGTLGRGSRLRLPGGLGWVEMTVDEYRRALSGLTAEQFQEFRRSWGGTEETVEKCVQAFAYSGHPWERTIVYHLHRLGVEGLNTEDEKLTEAALVSARSGQESARSARESAKVARWALVVAVIAALIALIAVGVQLFR